MTASWCEEDVVRRAGTLFVERVDLWSLCRRLQVPFYCYAASIACARLRRLQNAMGKHVDIHYSVKANDRLGVIALLASHGAGVELVSGGELLRACRAGVSPDKMIFAGVGKSPQELALALEKDIRAISVESIEELHALAALAKRRDQRAGILLRLNPDVAAGGHRKISTGKAGDKFGIGLEAFEDALAVCVRYRRYLHVRGPAIHIGSQIADVAPFTEAFASLHAPLQRLKDAGFAPDMADLGGGLAIPERPQDKTLDVEAYARAVQTFSIRSGLSRVAISPGRWLIATAGLLVAQVVSVKRQGGKNIAVLNVGMESLLRPALYHAWHDIVPVRQTSREKEPWDIVGPICESSDTFASGHRISSLAVGDWLVLRNAGAYAAVMSSRYNAREEIPELLIQDDRVAVIKEPESLDDCLQREKIPDWVSRTKSRR